MYFQSSFRLGSIVLNLVTVGLVFLLLSSVVVSAENAPQHEKLTIETSNGPFDFTIEVADETHERQKGLMHRTEMDPKHGMLFVFDSLQIVTMWMQNTPLSLDMIFVKPDGKVATIASRTTPFSTDVITSRVPVSHVLEVNAGISTLIGLKVGDRLVHPTFNSK